MRKKLLWITGSVVGLLVVATLVIRFLVPADTWKRLALEQFEARTGMHATAGSARLEFPWPVGLRLSDVTLRDERPHQPYRSLAASVDRVVVTAQLGSLLRRKPQVNEVRLVRPQLEVDLGTEPAPASATGATASQPTAPAEHAPGMAAVLGLMAIEDGTVTVRSDSSTVVLTGLDQSASLSLTEAGAFEGRLEGSLQSCRVSGPALPVEVTLPPLQVAMTLSGDLEQQSGRVQLERVQLGTLNASGPVTYAHAGEATNVTAQLDLGGDLTAFEPQLWTFVTLPPELVGQVHVQAASLRGQLSFAGTVPPADDDPKALLAGLSGKGDVEALTIALYDLPPFAAKGAWELKDGEVRLDPLHVEQEALTADGRLTADFENHVRGSLSAKADLRALRELGQQAWPHLPAATREGSMPPEQWPAMAGPVEVHANFEMQAGAPIDPLDLPVHLDATWHDVTFRPAGWKEDLQLASGRASGDLRQLEVQQVAFTGPGLSGRGTGTVGGWPDAIDCVAHVELDRLDVDALQAATAAAVETSWWSVPGVGVARADEATSLPAPPKNLSLDLDARSASVHAHGYELTDVKTTGRLAQQRFEIETAEGRLGTGRITAQGDVDWTTQTPRWDVKTQADAVPAGALLQPFAAVLAGALTADLSGTLNLAGPLSVQPAAILQALSGEGLVKSNGGHLRTEPVWGQRIQEFLGREGGLFRDVDFRELTAGITVADGKVKVDRALLRGDTALTLSGWVGLTGTCDYRLDVTLPPKAQPTFGALEPVVDLLRDDQGRLSFAVAMSGAAAKPDVRIDTQQLQDRAAAAARKRGEQKLGDLLSNQLKKEGSDSTTTDLKSQLEGKARDALGGLLGGKKKGKGGGGR